MNGGPDALLQLIGQHVLPASAPAVIAGDRLAARPALWAVTDTLPRSDHAFGVIDPTASYTYTATETNPADDPLGDAGGPPRQLLPVASAGHQTVAVLAGAATVTASSAGSWLAETPQIDPVNVFDNNPSTVWSEANPTTAVGQWVQITFSHRLVLPASIGIKLLDDQAARPVPRRLTVRTDAGVVTSAVRKTAAPQALQVPPGPTRMLRITIAAVRGGVPGGPGAGFASVSIPGVAVTRYLKVPQDIAGERAGATAFSFERPVPSPASLVNVAAYPPLARTFAAPIQGWFKLTASGLAVPGRALDAILSTLTPARRNTLEVTASSTLASLPSLAAANLMRRDHPGAWIAGGPKPAIRLAWRGRRTIRRMVIQPLPGLAAAPEAIKITSPQGTRYASIGLDGLTEIVPPLRTSKMTISFPVVQYAASGQPGSGQAQQLPVGLSKLSIPALAGLHLATLAPGTRFALPCGAGPQVTIDGRPLRTTVSGKVGGLISFQPVRIRLCGPRSEVLLLAGRNWLTVARPGAFTITDLSLTSGRWSAVAAGGLGPTSAAARRSVQVLSWKPEYRQVRVGPGAASYLEVHQNANPGWTASLDGRTLMPVRLDGWQQGFVVPAGSGGVVTLTFQPVKFYHVWIILSAAGVLVLLLVATARRRRRRVPEQMDRALPAAAGPTALLPPAALPALPSAAAPDRTEPAGDAFISGQEVPTAAAGLAQAGEAVTGQSVPPAPAGRRRALAVVARARAALAGPAAARWALAVVARARAALAGPAAARWALAVVARARAALAGPAGLIAAAVPARARTWWAWPRVSRLPALARRARARRSAGRRGRSHGARGTGGSACRLSVAALARLARSGRDDRRWRAHCACRPSRSARNGRVRGSRPGLRADRRCRCFDAGATRPPGGREMTERFAVPDELTCYYDRPAEPANVHVEIRIPGPLDESALRASVQAVLAAEPRVRVRRLRASRWRRSHYWEFPPVADTDPVRVAAYADEADLDRQRDEFLSQSPSLDTSPPVRFLLASGPGGASLILNAHHACFDGLSCLRLLRSVAWAYGTAERGTRAAQDGPVTGPAPAAAPTAARAVAAGLPAARPAARLSRRRVGTITRIAPGHDLSRGQVAAGIRCLPADLGRAGRH